jgi:hypothetical protein
VGTDVELNVFTDLSMCQNKVIPVHTMKARGGWRYLTVVLDGGSTAELQLSGLIGTGMQKIRIIGSVFEKRLNWQVEEVEKNLNKRLFQATYLCAYKQNINT